MGRRERSQDRRSVEKQQRWVAMAKSNRSGESEMRSCEYFNIPFETQLYPILEPSNTDSRIVTFECILLL
jgi:hypothetical protein